MIAYLKGIFLYKNPSSVIVDVQGVGYEVNISLNTYSVIQSLEKGLLYTHQIIREDAHLLFGFADVKEKEIFLALLSVSGIGANTARVILSYMKSGEVASAIMKGDSKTLEKIKGIGKKTAERTVLELKDKIGKTFINNGNAELVEDVNPIATDALNALLALGVNKIQAEQSIKIIIKNNPDILIEDLIKAVLKSF